MRISVLIIAVMTLPLCPGCTTKPATREQGDQQRAVATPDQFAAARQLFAKDCGECHGTEAEGKTTTIEGKRIKSPSLRAGHALKHPDEDYIKQIKKGGDGMPAFEKKLSDSQINDLIRFIRHDFQNNPN